MFDVLINELKGTGIVDLSIGIGSTFLGVFAFILRNRIEELVIYLFGSSFDKFQKFFYKLKGKRIQLSDKEANRDSLIKKLLNEIRVLGKADRSYIYQFHNGSVFNTGNSMWKISNVYETVSDGISTEALSLQNIPSTHMTDIISCFWREESLPNGVLKIDTDITDHHKKRVKLSRPIFSYIVTEMDEGTTKVILSRQGTQICVLCPLMDGDNRIGFLGLDYVKEYDKESGKEVAAEVVKYSTNISYMLTHEIYNS